MSNLRFALPAGALAICSILLAAVPASDTDRLFQSKVSQGGMYEVEASQLALRRAQSQDVKDIAFSEVHDHTLVGEKLKSLSLAAGLAFPSSLNPEFAERLARLQATPTGAFDSAYIADMKAIHAKDQKLFAQEAQDGSTGWKPFAAETDRIVKRHIGALDAD